MLTYVSQKYGKIKKRDLDEFKDGGEAATPAAKKTKAKVVDTPKSSRKRAKTSYTEEREDDEEEETTPSKKKVKHELEAEAEAEDDSV